MIKINRVFTMNFVEGYYDFILSSGINSSLEQIFKSAPLNLRNEVRFYFSGDRLKNILIGSANNFENIINEIYTNFPVIAERYCYSYLLKDLNIPFGSVEIDISSAQGKAVFDANLTATISALRNLRLGMYLPLTADYVKKLLSPIPRSKKLKYLTRLINAQRGKSQTTDKQKKLFPDWVNMIESCFNYNLISQVYGHIITQHLDVNVCPYCALENIQSYSGQNISVRPDLDHFYPKTRFPFLSISLYNLIPAGPICNQKHKKNHPMLGYMHPNIDGFEVEPVFNFGFIPDGDIRKTLRIDILKQRSIYKNKNVDIFKLRDLYNGNEDLREWFFNLYELKVFLKELGKDLSLIDFHSPIYKNNVDLSRPTTKVIGQKFKVEAINSLYNQRLQTINQTST